MIQATRLDTHASAILRELVLSGGLSRAELQRRTGLRSNTVIQVAGQMMEAGWLREAGHVPTSERPGGSSRGRPAVRLEVDPDQRDVVGVALSPRRIEAARVNLVGEAVFEPISRLVRQEAELIPAAAAIATELIGERTLALGISTTGLIDEDSRKLLLSSATPHLPGLPLDPLLDAADELPVALANDIQALGERWRLQHPDAAEQTVLLIGLGDGRIGASFMLGGSPADAGCVSGCNELGHFQIPTAGVELPACFCGQSHCLERAFSSVMAHRLTGRKMQLRTALRAAAEDQQGDAAKAGRWLIDRLRGAVANIVNFTRPHRVVWGDLDRRPILSAAVAERLNQGVRESVLPAIAHRVRFERWSVEQDDSPEAASTTAGYLAMAALTGRRAPVKGRLCLAPEIQAAVEGALA